MDETDILDVDTKSELKVDTFLGMLDQKWAWPLRSQDSKIGYISRMSGWNKLIFCLLIRIQRS